jgi:hypothetical protein
MQISLFLIRKEDFNAKKLDFVGKICTNIFGNFFFWRYFYNNSNFFQQKIEYFCYNLNFLLKNWMKDDFLTKNELKINFLDKKISLVLIYK